MEQMWQWNKPKFEHLLWKESNGVVDVKIIKNKPVF